MSNQEILTFMVGAARSDCERDLRSAGFQTTQERRAGGILLGVRVREGTDDETEATRIVEARVPDARRGPPASPTHSFVGYREGR
jgi:hypothetical protein